MKKPITSLQDLIDERHRLQMQLEVTKAQIRNDFKELQEEVNPALQVASFIGKVTTRDTRNNVLLKTGTHIAIDWVTRKFFPKTNFFIKLLAPVLLKNYTSHLLSKNNGVG